MAQYQYIDKAGKSQTVEAQNEQSALATAGKNSQSGVRLISAPVSTVPGNNVGSALNSVNTKPNNPINVTQPTAPVAGAVLTSDIMSNVSADTARARAEELAISQKQGTTTEQQIADYLKTTTAKPTTPTATVTTDPVTGLPVQANTKTGEITQETLDADKQKITDALMNTQGKQALTDAEYQASVDPLKVELNEINQQINEEALAGRRRTEAVLTVPGITKEQAQDRINEISRVNTSKLADLSIIQLAKQGRYDSAKEVADRKIAVLLEQKKNELDALQFTYQENKELFNKKEQREFETAQRDRERKLNNEEKVLTQISNLALDALANGASTSVVTKMQNAKTLAEATAIGGSFVGKLDRQLKQAQLTKTNIDIANARAEQISNQNGYKQLSYEDNARLNSTPEAKNIKDGSGFLTALQEYKNAIKKYGTGEVFGTGRGTLDSAYQAVVAKTKDYYTLGSLDDGVTKLVSMGIPKPTIWGQASARLAGIDEQIKGVSDTINKNVDQLGTTKYSQSVEGQQLLQLGKTTVQGANGDPLGLGISTNANKSTTSTDPLKIF